MTCCSAWGPAPSCCMAWRRASAGFRPWPEMLRQLPARSGMPPEGQSPGAAAHAEDSGTAKSYARPLLFAALTVGAVMLAWRLAAVLTLALGAVVLSIGLRGLARLLSRATHIGERWAVLPVVILLAGLFAAVGWMFGTQIGAQFDILVERLPETFSGFQRELVQRPWGRWLIDQVQDVNLPSATGALAGRIGAVFSTTLR